MRPLQARVAEVKAKIINKLLDEVIIFTQDWGCMDFNIEEFTKDKEVMKSIWVTKYMLIDDVAKKMKKHVKNEFKNL